METQASYVTVGAFVVACLLGLMVSLLWLAGSQYRQEFAFYRTYFVGPVTGLGRGTIVRYNGIEAGNIAELAFDQENPRLVIVTLRIDPTIRVHVDSVASIESQGITGAVFVEIEGGTAASPLLEGEGGQMAVIPSQSSTLQQLAAAGPQLLARFNTVGERIGDVLKEENRRLLTETLTNMRDMSASIGARSEDVRPILANLQKATAAMTATLDNIDRTLNSADRALSAADRTLGNADAALSSVDRAVGSLDNAIVSADTTVQKLGRLADSADKVVTGSGVAQMTLLVAQTRALVASLTRMTNDLQREPTRLILGDRQQGYTPP